jgi:hypothetical protein
MLHAGGCESLHGRYAALLLTEAYGTIRCRCDTVVPEFRLQEHVTECGTFKWDAGQWLLKQRPTGIQCLCGVIVHEEQVESHVFACEAMRDYFILRGKM